MPVHLTFDLLATALALALTAIIHRWRPAPPPLQPLQRGEGYFLSLSLGLALGSYGLGTLNLWLMGVPMVGRSIMGALAGAIAGVELWKAARGVRGSTGLFFVPAFATLVAVGRIGCALSGLDDQTYGLPTSLPWGHDFGDGIPRHPVALYESLSMAAFLTLALAAMATRAPLFMAHGFYLMVGFYALQRLLWEGLKPYPAVLGPLTVFQVTSLALLAYAAVMMRKARQDGHPRP